MSFYTRHTWRWVILLTCLALAFIGLLCRFVQLTVIDRAFLLRQGDARSQRVIERPALRGMITDRDHYPLAITTRVSSIWIDPQEFVVTRNNLSALSALLNDNVSVLEARLKSNNNKDFVYLKRHISPYLAQKIMALHLEGVHSLNEYRRYYPEAEVTSQVIGFTNIDNQGQEGMELAYNQWLTGVPGKEKVLKDGVGHVVALLGMLRPEEPGKELALSLDHRIQYLAYRDLAAAVSAVDAVAGSVIVLDVKTGEVLAMANAPSYNPNQGINPTMLNSVRNRCVTDSFEPGSTTKAMSLANVLAQGKYTPDSLVDTNPGWYILNGHRVSDPEGNNGVINMTTVLVKSSNVGTAKLTLTTPPNSLWELLHKMGYGQLTGSGFPGEVKGSLPLHKWSDFSLAALSFGYGLSATPLQVANAYATIARGGIKMPISMVKVSEIPQGERVMDAKIAGAVKRMLEAVVEQAAVKGQVSGYRVLGKTGTTRVLDSTGHYDPKRHMAFFVGAAPASDPRLVVMVLLQEPHKGYYSAQILAPAFSQIMGGALRVLDIAPDKEDNKG